MWSLIYHFYFIFVGIIIGSYNPMAAMTIMILYVIFSWFHASIFLDSFPMDFNNGSYCPTCKCITGMGLKHCNLCHRCIPEKWVHSQILNRCTNKFFLKRWIRLFRVVVAMFFLLTIICTMINIQVVFFVPLHVFILKTTYK